jgi:hypothetical protein
LVPPKPNEFDSAYSMAIARLCAARSRGRTRVRRVEVDGRRHLLVRHGQRGDAGLEPAGRAEQVAGHRLGGRDRQLPRVVAEAALDGQRLVGSLCGVEVPWALM